MTLAPHVTPNELRNFDNFIPTGQPILEALFDVVAGELSTERLTADVHAALHSANKGDQTLVASQEFVDVSKELVEALVKPYLPLCDSTLADHQVHVIREGAGAYRFTIPPDGDACIPSTWGAPDETLLRQTITRLQPQNTQPGNLLVGGSYRPLRLITGREVSRLLFRQFPPIVYFSQAYKLDEDLPDEIFLRHLDEGSPPLLAAFVGYLGIDDVRRVLTAPDMRERRQLLNALQARIAALTDEIRSEFADAPDLRVDLDIGLGGGLQVMLIVDSGASPYRQMSENAKILFAYYLYRLARAPEGSILLFDEPSNGFHATAQQALRAFLFALGRAGNQIVVSTHSEYLIDPDNLSGVRLMGHDKEDHLTASNHYFQPLGGAGDVLALRPIADAIGLVYGTLRLHMSDRVVVTEGVSDMLFLQTFHAILGYAGELHIAPAAGAKAIPQVLALLIAQTMRFKVFLDTETGGSTTKTVIQRHYKVGDDYIHEVPIPAQSVKGHGSGIEDLFSKDDFRKLLERMGAPVTEADFACMSNSEYMRDRHPSKRIVADWFHQKRREFTAADFDTETLTQVRAALDFCAADCWFRLPPEGE